MSHGGSLVQHHIRVSKLGTKIREIFISHKNFKRIFNKFILAIAFIAPSANIPQVYKIFVTQSATDVSLLSLIMHFGFIIPWVIYAIIHQEKPLLITNILWIMIYSILIGQCLYFG